MSRVPPVLLPYQQRWISDPSQIKLYTKSRRIGITWAQASDDVLLAARADGMDVTYICYDEDVTRGYVKDCAAWAKAYKLAVKAIDEKMEVFRDEKEDKSILVFRIYFASGFEIQAIAGVPRKLRGRKGRLVIDEAAFTDQFLKIFEAGLAFLIWGGDIRIMTTYNGIDNQYYEFEKEVLEGKYPYSRHFTTFRQAIRQGLYERICLVQGKEWSAELEEQWIAQIYDQFGGRAAQELDCIPAQSDGVYLPRVLIEACMQPDIPILRLEYKDEFTLRPEHERVATTNAWLEARLAPLLSNLDRLKKSFVGQDFGRSGDISVIAVCQEERNLTRRIPFALELRNVPYEQQKQILFYLCDRLPRLQGIAIDKTGNGGYLGEVALQRYGVTNTFPIHLTSQFYAEHFPRYKSAIEDKKIILPADGDWLDDHRSVTMAKGVPRVPETARKGRDGKQRHSDSAIACLLLWYASEVAVDIPIAFEAVGKPRFGFGEEELVNGRYR